MRAHTLSLYLSPTRSLSPPLSLSFCILLSLFTPVRKKRASYGIRCWSPSHSSLRLDRLPGPRGGTRTWARLGGFWGEGTLVDYGGWLADWLKRAKLNQAATPWAGLAGIPNDPLSQLVPVSLFGRNDMAPPTSFQIRYNVCRYCRKEDGVVRMGTYSETQPVISRWQEGKKKKKEKRKK